MSFSRTLVAAPRVLFAVALLTSSAAAQLQPTWVSIQDPSPGSTSLAGQAHRVTVDGAGFIYSAGVVETYPSQDLVVMKLDASGVTQWNSTFPQLAPALYPQAIDVSSSGAAAVVGIYVDRLDEADRQRVRDACAAQLPPAPFEVTASAWTVRGRA